MTVHMWSEKLLPFTVEYGLIPVESMKKFAHLAGKDLAVNALSDHS